MMNTKARELLNISRIILDESSTRDAQRVLKINQTAITQAKTTAEIADLLNSNCTTVEFQVSSKRGNLQELVATGGVVGNLDLSAGDFRVSRSKSNPGTISGILLARHTDTDDGVVTDYTKNLTTSNAQGADVVTLYYNTVQLFRLSDKGWAKFVNGISKYLNNISAIMTGTKVPVMSPAKTSIGNFVNPTIGDLFGIITGRVQIDPTLISDSHAEILQRMIDMYSDQPDNLLVIPSVIWYQFGYHKFADESGIEYLFWKGSIEGDNMTYDGGFVMVHFDQFSALATVKTPDFKFEAMKGSDGILYLRTMTDTRIGAASTTQIAYSATTSTRLPSDSSPIDYDEFNTALDQLFGGSIDSSFISTVVRIGRAIPRGDIEYMMSDHHSESAERVDTMRRVVRAKLESMSASSDQIKQKLGDFSYNYVYNPYGIEDGKELSTDAKTKLSKLVDKTKSLDASASSILAIFKRLGIEL